MSALLLQQVPDEPPQGGKEREHLLLPFPLHEQGDQGSGGGVSHLKGAEVGVLITPTIFQ